MTTIEAFDILIIVFWLFTFIPISFYSFKEKKGFFPYVCGWMNISWVVIRLSKSFNNNYFYLIGFILRGLLGIIMLIPFYLYGGIFLNKKKGYLYILIIVPIIVISFSFLLEYLIPDFILYYPFYINVILTIFMFLYLLLKKEKSSFTLLLIYLCKFIGILIPTISYGILKDDFHILMVGIIDAYCDLIAFIYCSIIYRKNRLPFAK